MFSFLKKYRKVCFSSLFLMAALLLDYTGFSRILALILYAISYLFVGGIIWAKAFRSIRKGTIFSEFLLMGIATSGAFVLGQYAEGVAVMLFYMIGENVQHGAVHRARHSIKKLINQQPDIACVERSDNLEKVHPSDINIGEIIHVKPGEKIPLDGQLITDQASLNTAALTGESKPVIRHEGEEVWAGSFNQDVPIRIKVTHPFNDTKLSNIIKMVQDAAQRKAPTQRFISTFARIYTPVVVWLAVALTIIPWLFVEYYVFQDWLYRALIFLVVSCPCGLLISIPLGYFGGIGAASKNGILFKGSDFIDRIRQMDTLFMDKTGTVTKGNFEVNEIRPLNGYKETTILSYTASLEQQSTHPIAQAIMNYTNGQKLQEVSEQKEIAGKGLTGIVQNHQIVVGTNELLAQYDIDVETNKPREPITYIHIGIDGKYAGWISIADQLKEDSQKAINELKSLGLKKLIILSGDNPETVDFISSQLNITEAYGGLLPDQKYRRVEKALDASHSVGFVGDGANDAPVINLADVGLAMGGIGSDASIEVADVVIQTDQLSKIPSAIRIAHFTHRVVWQNIGFALGIKLMVMVLAGLGIATMWEAVFADVGVALIAVANAVRVLNKNYL